MHTAVSVHLVAAAIAHAHGQIVISQAQIKILMVKDLLMLTITPQAANN
mgnify:CR=1 FL=1